MAYGGKNGKKQGLSPNQAAQIAAAPPHRRKALRALYTSQNAPRPAPRAAPARAAPPRRKQAARARGTPNFMDPMCPMCPPTTVSQGKALPHNGLVSGDFVVGTTNTTLLVCTNTGDSGTVGVLWNVSPAGEYVDGMRVFTIPTLAQPDSENGASAVRASKLSVSVTNCSNALKRGGRVTYLNSSQRLPYRATNAANRYAAILSGVKDSPYRRRITGDLLSHPKQLISYPVDGPAYESFHPHFGTLSESEFCSYVFRASVTDNVPHTRPMSIIVFIFDPVADPQDYSVTIRASYYTRWPLTTVPGQSMKLMPTADAKLINHVRDHAENTANDMVHIAEGGAIAMTAPRIAGGLRSVGSSVMGRIGGAVSRGITTAEGVAGDLLGAEGLAIAEMAVPLIA